MQRQKSAGAVVGRVARQVGRTAVGVMTSPLRLAGAGGGRPRAGAAPGIEPVLQQPASKGPSELRLRCIDYGPDSVVEQEPGTVEELLALARPEGSVVRWIDVAGLDPQVVHRLQAQHEFHTLAAEDVLHVPQRPKCEVYPDHLFVVSRMVRELDEGLVSEQVSLFLRDGLLVTFQEELGDPWDPIRQRIRTEGSRIRRKGADYLLYAILDAVVDHGFPILERYGDRLEALEEQVWDDSGPELLQAIHSIKRELGLLRRILWPTREMVGRLIRDEDAPLSESARTFLRDVDDHALQLVDMVEVQRESAGSLTELTMSIASNRMNEVMKVLTIMASLFIPITFLAGVYGMNFENIPELSFPWAYPVFWGICLVVLAALIVYFRRKGWLGRG